MCACYYIYNKIDKGGNNDPFNHFAIKITKNLRKCIVTF